MVALSVVIAVSRWGKEMLSVIKALGSIYIYFLREDTPYVVIF